MYENKNKITNKKKQQIEKIQQKSKKRKPKSAKLPKIKSSIKLFFQQILKIHKKITDQLKF